MKLVVEPYKAVLEHWKSTRVPGSMMADVNGDDIGSNSPAGVLKRLKTWMKKHDAGKDGKQVVLNVMGHKTMVLTPISREEQWISGFPPQVIQRFDVKLWNGERECQGIDGEFQTCVWEKPET